MDSILHSKEDGCLVCGNPFVEEHHVFYGTANRKLSEKYGLKVYLCAEHHRGNTGVHHDHTFDRSLKRMAQRKFIEQFDDERKGLNKFMEIFGENYDY